MKNRKRAWRKGVYSEYFCIFILIIKGYKILALRYKTKVGEIDIISTRSGTLVFVEVKARTNKEAGLFAISARQKKRIENAASLFLSRWKKKQFKAVRFDVMVVLPWRWPVHLSNAWQLNN